MTHPPCTATRLEHLLARGVLAVRRGSLDWIRRHPVLTDAALAAAVLAASVLLAGHTPTGIKACRWRCPSRWSARLRGGGAHPSRSSWS